MQKLVITTITSGLLAASSAVAGDFTVPVPAPTPAPAANLGQLTAGYSSVFNFRGIDLGNDHVSTGLNLSKSIAGFDLDFGALYHSTEDAFGVNADRLDLSLFASRDLGFAKAHVGYIHYNNFDDRDDAQEVAFGLSKDLFGIKTSLTYFWDVETDNNGYTELGLAKSFNVFGKALDLGATVGYLVEEGGFSHATVGLSHDIPFGAATLTPYIAHVWELDELETTSSRGSEDNELIGGVRLSVKF